MNIEGRALIVNRNSRVAAVDIGWGMALVVEYSADTLIDEGDRLEQLTTGYRKINILNRNKAQEVSVQVLADAMPFTLAEYIVREDQSLSQAAA
ncbi:hypothetical protein SAMN02745866_02642 [Alteromonadaceae bacterium Bs31]|nr:hypothetical protein SAMN02745866_02642 [Alteromonadaceae bacterium Bs31]